MQVILLEKIARLGNFGDTVQVRPGYGRNFLIPQGIALAATAANLKYFAAQREELERQHEMRRQHSLSRVEKLEKVLLRVEVNASEDGKMYGSVSVRDVIAMLHDRDIQVQRNEISLPEEHIRHIGEYQVTVTIENERIVHIPLEIVPAVKTG